MKMRTKRDKNEICLRNECERDVGKSERKKQIQVQERFIIQPFQKLKLNIKNFKGGELKKKLNYALFLLEKKSLNLRVRMRLKALKLHTTDKNCYAYKKKRITIY